MCAYCDQPSQTQECITCLLERIFYAEAWRKKSEKIDGFRVLFMPETRIHLIETEQVSQN